MRPQEEAWLRGFLEVASPPASFSTLKISYGWDESWLLGWQGAVTVGSVGQLNLKHGRVGSNGCAKQQRLSKIPITMLCGWRDDVCVYVVSYKRIRGICESILGLYFPEWEGNS